MKKLSVILACTLLGASLLTGCGQKAEETNATAKTEEAKEESAEADADLLSGIYKAEIVVADYGTISIEMDADKAPVTVTNFVGLVEDGFYDGLTFHRVIDGFMMQGGDPLGNGTGNTGTTIKGEFLANGIENDQSHTRGAVSMARSQNMDSASCQFFIVHEDSTFLDGQYACFGYVTDGMDVVDAVCENTPVIDNNGTVKADDQPVIESIKIVE